MDCNIKEFRFWDSYDSPADAWEMLREVVEETGFISPTSADVLIAFTDQDISLAYGLSNRTLGVVLLEETYLSGVGQATDNILQHELSHLYQAEHHDIQDFDCVMNIYPYWIWELCDIVPHSFMTNNWCENCINTIDAHRTDWGVAYYVGGGGGGGGRYWEIP